MKRQVLRGVVGVLLWLVSLTATAQSAIVKERVEPLLTTAWGQDAPYNALCPEKENGQGVWQHCKVGCVACAMGQVMNYHQYPEVGIGTGTNMFNTSLTVNYGETYYDWQHMRNSYVGNYSDEEATAVATLLYHCGVSVNMIYGLQSSATFTAFANNMTTALTKCFGYDSGVRSVSRSNYTKDEWLQLIREELSAGRPIIYSGNSATMGGHTWVVDGYDEAGRVHMNWGWLGLSNNYYDIDLPTAGVDFNQKQSMIIGIQPPTATAIRQVDADRSSQVWYTLDGRIVEHPKAGGLYIRNGKKVLFK
jgi:hypothetical protein